MTFIWSKVKFCPICKGELKLHYNIDIDEFDGLECRTDQLFIEFHSVLPGAMQFSFEQYGEV